MIYSCFSHVTEALAPGIFLIQFANWELSCGTAYMMFFVAFPEFQTLPDSLVSVYG